MTIPSSKIHLRCAFTYNLKLVIPRDQINFRKIACPLELIKQLINPCEGMLFIYGDLIKLTVVNAHRKGLIFLKKEHQISPWRGTRF